MLQFRTQKMHFKFTITLILFIDLLNLYRMVKNLRNMLNFIIPFVNSTMTKLVI